MTRILAIDGSFLARSRYEVGSLPGGFIDKVQSLVAELRPALVYIAWDHPTGSASRKAICPDYKGNRGPKPPEYVTGTAELRKALPWYGWYQIESPDGEADDVLATIARTLPGPCVIFSADKDFLQLVRPGVSLLRAGRARVPDMLITETNIRESKIKYGQTIVTGLDADGWLDLQTLAGDPGDKIAGVPGIGPAKALQLLDDVPALRAVLAGAAPPPESKLLAKIAAHPTEVAQTRALVSLYTVPLHVTMADPSARCADQWLAEQGLPGIYDSP